jgi:hypothetical protein
MGVSDLVGSIGSILSAGVAVCALVIAYRANKRADRANDIGLQAVRKADVANAIAVDANQLALRVDERGRERHDVRWVRAWNETGDEWRLNNVGVDIAYKVTLIAAIRGMEIVETASEVQSRGYLALEQPREPLLRVQDQEQWTRNAHNGFFGNLPGETPVTFRLYWSSALGTLKSFESAT